MPSFSATSSASLLSSSHGHSLEIVTESSCQFFMKRPMTSYPCCCRRYAATLESTPPDNPTTTFFMVSPLPLPVPELRLEFQLFSLCSSVSKSGIFPSSRVCRLQKIPSNRAFLLPCNFLWKRFARFRRDKPPALHKVRLHNSP